MTLNLKSENSFYVFDSYGMLIVRDDHSEIKRTKWQRLWDWILKRKFEPVFENLSWRDSIGMTVCAWIAYGRPEELFDAIEHCYNNPVLYRHPNHWEKSSRDHWSYFLIQGYMEYGISRICTNNLRMRGMNFWMKSLTGNKLAERLYYLIYIPGALIGNVWLRICRWVGMIKPERDNNWWIGWSPLLYVDGDVIIPQDIIHNSDSNGIILHHTRTKWQKIWAWIIFQTIPAYPLHNKGWQLYVMPESKRKERLKRILLKRVGKSNILLRLLFGDTEISQQDVDNYPYMISFRPGVYLDETCRRTIREMTEVEASANTYEKDLIIWLYEIQMGK